MFEEKIKVCREWFYGIKVLYADKLDISIAVDDSNEFVANIDSAHLRKRIWTFLNKLKAICYLGVRNIL